MKVLNIIKDMRNETINFSTGLGFPLSFQGDAFSNDADIFILTVPLNFKGDIEDKFVRFANKNKDRIKLLIVVIGPIEGVPSNLNEIDIEHKFIVNVYSEEDTINNIKKIKNRVIEL